jgi:hypothetical protein
VAYSLKTTPKDLQRTNASAISAHSVAIARFNSCKASGCWKEKFPYGPFIRLILGLWCAFVIYVCARAFALAAYYPRLARALD